MRKPKGMTASESFFWQHAGYSYGKGETAAQGRERCARELASAEVIGAAYGLSFSWEYDDTTDEDFRPTSDPYRLWSCVCYLNGEVMASCGGIDLGRDGLPQADPYARVMRAELAQEALCNRPGAAPTRADDAQAATHA